MALRARLTLNIDWKVVFRPSLTGGGSQFIVQWIHSRGIFYQLNVIKRILTRIKLTKINKLYIRLGFNIKKRIELKNIN